MKQFFLSLITNATQPGTAGAFWEGALVGGICVTGFGFLAWVLGL